jgi:hypothetical protein
MSRANIAPGQLYGKCATYPEWGAVRHFRLRGFELTLEFRNPVFTWGEYAKHAIKTFDLHVQVRPDPSATSPMAGPSKYIFWGFLPRAHPCEKVFVGRAATDE